MAFFYLTIVMAVRMGVLQTLPLAPISESACPVKLDLLFYRGMVDSNQRISRQDLNN